MTCYYKAHWITEPANKELIEQSRIFHIHADIKVSTLTFSLCVIINGD